MIEPVEECRCRGDEDAGASGTFWCKYHECRKTQHWRDLCRDKAGYRNAWNNGRGLGHQLTDTGAPPIVLVSPVRIALIESRLVICESCDEYMGKRRCKKCDLGCRTNLCNRLRAPSGKCPLDKWPCNKET